MRVVVSLCSSWASLAFSMCFSWFGSLVDWITGQRRSRGLPSRYTGTEWKKRRGKLVCGERRMMRSRVPLH